MILHPHNIRRMYNGNSADIKLVLIGIAGKDILVSDQDNFNMTG